MRAAVKAILIFVILLSVHSIASAQNYYFQQYSLEEGLPQSQVQVIFQDSRGLIWVGTNGGGLCRFNGKKFKVFTNRDSLAGNMITDIFEDHKGNLWIGSTTGITFYDGIHFEPVFFDSLDAVQYGNFSEDKIGNI